MTSYVDNKGKRIRGANVDYSVDKKYSSNLNYKRSISEIELIKIIKFKNKEETVEFVVNNFDNIEKTEKIEKIFKVIGYNYDFLSNPSNLDELKNIIKNYRSTKSDNNKVKIKNTFGCGSNFFLNYKQLYSLKVYMKTELIIRFIDFENFKTIDDLLIYFDKYIKLYDEKIRIENPNITELEYNLKCLHYVENEIKNDLKKNNLIENDLKKNDLIKKSLKKSSTLNKNEKEKEKKVVMKSVEYIKKMK